MGYAKCTEKVMHSFLFAKSLFIFTVLIICVRSASGPQDMNESSLRKVSEQLSTAPDTEIITLLNNPQNQTIIGEGKESQSEVSKHNIRQTQTDDEETDLDAYLMKLYGFYFSENTYPIFIKVHLLHLHAYAANNHYKIKANKIEIERTDQNNRRYDFIVHVQYASETGDKKNKTAKIIGFVNFSEEG